MEAKINLAFFHIQELNFPFVEGAFRCKNGKYLDGYFLIDTGSNQNVFNGAAQRLLSDECITSNTHTITSVDNEGENCPIANVDIVLDECKCNETFCISNGINYSDFFGDNHIIGILGSNFLLKHGLSLNLQDNCLQNSCISVDNNKPLSFLFPMGYGLRYFGIPVVGFVKDDNEYLCVADSGCNTSTIAQYPVEEGMIMVEQLNEKRVVTGISDSCTTSSAKVKFNLLSIGEQKGTTSLVEAEDRINILPNRRYIAPSREENAPAIAGLLSTPFMMSQKWILDFKHQVIYAYAA